MGKSIMKWYKIQKGWTLDDMPVEENYPIFHKSWIKGKQWLKQWLVKMGSKQSNKWNTGWNFFQKVEIQENKGWNKAQKRRS